MSSRAALPSNLEAEAGVLSSSGAQQLADSNASGGHYVRFTNPSSPTIMPIPTPANSVTVPSNIDRTGTTDVTVALNNFIKSVPDGTTIVFPQGSVYLLSEGIQFKNRKNLTFHGYGSKLKLKEGSGFGQRQSLFLLGFEYGTYSGGVNRNIVIRGFELESNYTTIGFHDFGTQHQHAIEANHSDGVEIYDTVARRIGGDGLKFTNGYNIYYHDNIVEDAGRQGISVISGGGLVAENNHFGKIGYYILDLEPNYDNQAIRDITFRNNTWERYSRDSGVGGGFVAFGNSAGQEWSNITISGNKNTSFETDKYGPASTCRMYINNSNIADKNINNVVINNNSCAQSDSGPLIYAHKVNNLQITNNSQPHTGTLIRQSNNTGTVTISGNTPD